MLKVARLFFSAEGGGKAEERGGVRVHAVDDGEGKEGGALVCVI